MGVVIHGTPWEQKFKITATTVLQFLQPNFLFSLLAIFEILILPKVVEQEAQGP